MSAWVDAAPKSSEERVIVVPTATLRASGPAPGFDPDPARLTSIALKPGVARAMPRSLAEADPRYKQLVAYVVLRCQGQIFHYLRSAHVGEARLAGRRSLGVGGHVNATDWKAGAGWEGLARGLARELDEEVELTTRPTIQYVGFIDDDQEPVSRVHLGVVALAELASPRVRLRDATLRDGRFDDPAAIFARRDEFEGWSQLCLSWLQGLRAEKGERLLSR